MLNLPDQWSLLRQYIMICEDNKAADQRKNKANYDL
jgi:hypothetical protein